MAATEIEQRSIDTIRTLAMDAVQQANAGHPGTAMALAPLAYLLYTEVMDHNPANAHWPDRDRFVLSAGHACILQYAALHLAGYNLSLEELKRFRQWESLTPGHPEVHHTPGVEATTGPLGQGFANGVGFGIAERFLAELFNRPYDDVVSIIEEQYRQAIDEIASPHPAFRWLGASETPEERLAEHVMVWYWRGRADLSTGGLLDSFYTHAPDSLRGHAMEFLGRSLRETRTADETLLRRMQAVWESRLESGEASGSRKELGAFGWWFSAGVLADDWRLAQAEAVLKKGVRLEPNFAVFATLAALAPERPWPTARILRMMLEQEKDGWGIDAHRDDIKNALAAILAGSDSEARQLAVETAHWLGSLGYRDFRPLVAASRSFGTGL